MFTLWSDMDRLFNILNEREYANAEPKFRMNLEDKGNNLEFVAELPGVSDKDLSLEVHDDTLTLSAKRDVQHQKDNNYFLAERGSWNIQRSISLPVAVETENAKADFKNGVLRVTLPKAPEARPQHIAINA